ncbi:hypothetical protein G9X67_34525 [Rhizobium sp. WYCCWR 11152]|uniref:hypothetical protein n=1 Tax=Rhizobium sp. WYCCWR 11152 TaxID=2692316 RepID=UPI0014929907|nr:hypothetical protein [Rhizobium sp. WYCCWR 11152]NNU70373.1 hypothetical protein [Rhizobium sp. WYCCWR 11152]
MDDKFHKDLDLHESEWSKAGKKEPFWGPGAFWFFNVTLPLFILAIVLSQISKFIYRAVLGY